MSKELIISVTPQETKAAILDNEQVVEIYIEREREQSIVGSICKGRVTKVLPGMQSAFVDIGLERDAFLYVSDFFEDTEEYDKIVTTAEEQVARYEQGAKEVRPAEGEPVVLAATPAEAPPAGGGKFADRRGRTRRARRNRLRGKRFDESTPETPAEPAVVVPEPAPPVEVPIILPGETLAKYRGKEPGEFGGPGESEASAEGEGLAPEEIQEAADALEAADELELMDEEKSPLLQVEVPAAEISLESEPLPLPMEALPGNTPEPLPLGIEAAAGTAMAEREVLSVLPGEKRAIRPSIPAEAPAVPEKGEEAKAESLPLAGPEPPAEALAGKSKPEPSNLESAPSLSAPNVAESTTAAPSQDLPVQETENVPRALPATPTAPPAKAEIRNHPGPARFFRHGSDNRRRQHGHNRERKEQESPAGYPLIADLLKEGQEILVQVAKEPLGTKGARITSHIALPGRYLVYMPTVDHIGVSRKIDSDEERQRLKRIIQEQRGNLTGGFIVRTAGQGRGEDEFRSDLKYLGALWADIRSKCEKKSAPMVIHRDLTLVQRLLRDHLSPDFVAIRVDNEVEYAGVLEFVNRFMPSMVSRVKLYLKNTPIFEEFGVQAEIEKALRSKVWLKSGGYIVLDQAEAMVAIDVNTGKYVGKSNKLEDTIVKTNLEAAKEIARQIRLRDLGGIIVCDFIDMEDRKNRQKVTQALEEALRGDKSPSKILQFNDFGLVAITRKRVKQSLLKTLCEPCSNCNGLGMVKSPQTICYEIQGEAKKMAKMLENKEITIRVNPLVAKSLKGEEASVINEIETTQRKEVVIKSDPLLHQEQFDIF
jgi:ribonuclease G